MIGINSFIPAGLVKIIKLRFVFFPLYGKKKLLFIFSDMYRVSMAIVECGSYNQSQSEPSEIFNRIFRVESNTLDWKFDGAQPDTKRRKLNDQKCHLYIKNNPLLKSSESAVITSGRTVPKMFVDAEKHFSVIIFWEMKHSDSSCERIQSAGLLKNVFNQCIGQVSLTIENIIDSHLEITPATTPSK